MSDAHDVSRMVEVYKKLFILLIAITALGIILSALHMPWGLTLGLALVIIAIKSKLVFDAFKSLLVGKNVLILVFFLTIVFFASLVLLPALTHHDAIQGTEDISKKILAEHVPTEGHHGH